MVFRQRLRRHCPVYKVEGARSSRGEGGRRNFERCPVLSCPVQIDKLDDFNSYTVFVQLAKQANNHGSHH